MRFCERCGAKNDDDSRFCTSCGQPVDADDPGIMPIAGGMPNARAAAPAHAAAPAPEAKPAPNPIPIDYETSEFPGWQDSPQRAIGAASAAELGALAQGQAEAQTLLRSTDEKIAAIDERLAGMEKAFADLADQFQEKISRNEHEATALKQVSAEIEEYRNGLYEKLTMPFIRDIIDVRTGMEQMLARHAAQESVPASEVAVFCQMLADTLTKNSVEIIASEEGDEFLSFKHKVVGQAPTSDPSLHGRIAAVEGESYRLGDQYIAPALVKIYTLEEGASETGSN